MVEIRQATTGDVRQLLALVAEYWAFEGIAGFVPERVAAQLSRLLSSAELGAGWMAVEEGEAVGYLLAVQVFSLEYLGLTAEIDEFFVLASQRGRGVGAALLNTAEAEFGRRGYTQVSLQLSRTNPSALQFYRGLGYAQRADYGLLDKPLGLNA
ncbi:MAG: GNAT family N-acetyltransferase [Pseudomonas sp.]|uniref:GNAT family N-acetyltransferase n=1 Tax=Pseudomonas sp. TaxID=306 RepID=UPI0033920035